MAMDLRLSDEDVAQLKALAEALKVGPVQDLGLLDPSAHRPRSSLTGQQAYPTMRAKAVALMHSLVCDHALVDGNKRLRLLAMAGMKRNRFPAIPLKLPDLQRCKMIMR